MVVKDDRVWKRIKQNLLSANKKVMKVGFFEESRYGPENDNLPVATVAAIQDLGSSSIPPRAFVREGTVQAVRRNKDHIQDRMKKALKDIANKNSPVDAEYKEIGSLIAGIMKRAIDTWSVPPNAPSTVASKGRNNPLIDSTHMRNSVKAKVERK